MLLLEKFRDKSLTRKGRDWDYDKPSISVIMCDTDIPQRLTNSWGWPYNFRSDDFNLGLGTLGSVASLLAVTFFQGHHDMNHNPWDIVSAVRYILHMQVAVESFVIMEQGC